MAEIASESFLASWYRLLIATSRVDSAVRRQAAQMRAMLQTALEDRRSGVESRKSRLANRPLAVPIGLREVFTAKSTTPDRRG